MTSKGRGSSLDSVSDELLQKENVQQRRATDRTDLEKVKEIDQSHQEDGSGAGTPYGK